MADVVYNYLTNKGYKIDDGSLDIINETNDWFTNQKIKGFHDATMVNGETYDLERMNFAKTICSDDANLVEAVNIVAQKDDVSNKEINAVLEENEFVNMYRSQTEECSANGTVGAYIRMDNAEIYEDGSIKNGTIRIEYCNALSIVPLTVINNKITECAFISTKYVDGGTYYQIVMFYLENGLYRADTVLLDKYGKEKQSQFIQLGDVKPFAIMRIAEVNNLEMKGYGLPKLWKAIPSLKILDLTFTMWRRDLEKADKLILLNEKLSSKDKDGKPIPPSKAMKKIFVQLGKEKLPNENALYQEYNPTIRITEFESSMELALSMLSMSFGYGTKKYTFEQGRIVTATEYAGEKQDMLQSINKQRAENTNYITDIIKAIRWFSNEFNGTNFADDEISIDFDDTYIEDKTAVAKQMRDDALSFGIESLTMKYFMKQYNLTEDEAKKWMDEMNSNDDGTQLEE